MLSRTLSISTLQGYTQLAILSQSERTKIYRAVQKDTEQAVVVKVMCSEHPSFSELVQFRNQYAIAYNLHHPAIVNPIALERYGNGYALIMPDEGFVSLPTYWSQQAYQGTKRIESVLAIAIQLADILHYLNGQRVIHKDIKPTNILIHPETQELQLIDFSIASLLPQERQELANPNVLEGTLAYLSPEQTGRMNRGIDYRSDFYAVGVTLYELLTGQLPFPTSKPMELVHHHIATVPPIAHALNPMVPTILSEIILKLMAKNAEDRYQSALGLKADLERCREAWQGSDTELYFPLGEKDVSDRFLIPETLYGRHDEVTALLESFNRVSTGHPELMLVAGFSGVGKTAVVNEIHKPITRQNGYFVKGKFDQFNRNIPFSAVTQALRSLVRQWLSESDAQLQTWKTTILKAVGESAQVLIEVIPELEQVIGLQPSVPELSGAAAQNRFNRLFQTFIGVIATATHPLVIFLDDLQWADSASLTLIKVLMENNCGHILLLGAYRDNEVFPAHPLLLTLAELDKQQAIVSTLTLEPLGSDHINQLVTDTLRCSLQDARPLTELVYQKTQGNPFFTTQFLKGLHEDHFLSFNRDAGHWQCDLSQVQQAALTDNVVQFMVKRLQSLPANTQTLLTFAACMGNRFDLRTLSIVCEQPQDEAAAGLWSALKVGLVAPENETYKFFQGEEHRPESKDEFGHDLTVTYRFLHDRIQQAAYLLIPESQKASTHWAIGQLLLKREEDLHQDEQLFDLVNQLNLGRATITQSDTASEDYQQLAWFNLKAAQKAKLAAAHHATQDYCNIGIEALIQAFGNQAWQQAYDLIYQLHHCGSEAAYLCGEFDQAESLYAAALDYARTALDKAAIYRVQMTQYQFQGRNAEAIAIQRQSLELLGWQVPETSAAIQEELDAQIETVRQFVDQHSIASILDLPQMDAEDIAEMLRILQILFYAAWLNGQSTLAFLAMTKMATLSLEHGNSDRSPFGYSGYGLVVKVTCNDAKTAYAFGSMAVKLCEQFNNADVRSMTNFSFAANVHSWSHPLREADPYYDNALKYGMEAGNWLTVSFTMMLHGSDGLTYGKDLNELYEIAQTHADFLAQVKSLENRDALIVGVLQPVRQLLGLTHNVLSFDDDGFKEATFLEKYHQTPYHLAWFYSVKIRHAYLFQHHHLYDELISKLSLVEKTVSTHAKVPSSVFYGTLMHLTLIENLPEDAKQERQVHWQALADLELKLERWVQDCSENIYHKWLLIQAEKAQIQDQKAEAIEYYEQAIAHAQEQGYGYEAALANERAALFYLKWNKQTVAGGYMQEAYYGYAHWGGKAKTDDLAQRYPQLLKPILEAPASVNLSDTLATLSLPNLAAPSDQTISAPSAISLNTALDFASVLKTSQAISNIIELDELLKQLTHIILENSGGDRCALMLPNAHKQWEVRAITQGSHEASVTPESTRLCTEPLTDHPNLPTQFIHYVKNTQETLVIDGSSAYPAIEDTYLDQHQPQSVLGLPLLKQGTLVGILYVQNQVTRGVFTNERLLVLNSLCSQAAIALENARLYQQAQDYARKLEESQLQLVQSEKMSALGNLVAGVAHEINNPLGFVSGNIGVLQQSFNEITACLNAYRTTYSPPSNEITKLIDSTDLDFVLDDAPKILHSMEVGCDRIQGISTSLRIFSRADTESTVKANIHEGLDSTLLILKYRLKAKEFRPEIEVIYHYGELPDIHCFPGQLNQVFMNILANAIDMFDEMANAHSYDDLEANPQQITIRTQVVNAKSVEICISDNGSGMSEEVRAKIFDRTFTTKAVGKGTGLGLAIVHQVITEKHSGTIEVESDMEAGTSFIINLPV